MGLSGCLLAACLNMDSDKVKYPILLIIGQAFLVIQILIAITAIIILVYDDSLRMKKALFIAFLIACLSLLCGLVLLLLSSMLKGFRVVELELGDRRNGVHVDEITG